MYAMHADVYIRVDVYMQVRRMTKNERKNTTITAKVAAAAAAATVIATAASSTTNEIDDGRCFNLSIRTILHQGHAYTSLFWQEGYLVLV